MVRRLQGQWPNPIRLLVAWIKQDLHMQAMSRLPDNVGEHLPAVILSGAPAGHMDGYTRGASVDIDVYAADWHQMAAVTGRLEASLFRLAGNGTQAGYADDTDLTSWTSRGYDRDPGVLVCTATVTLTLRPQPTHND